MNRIRIILTLVLSLWLTSASAQEKVFADYFDIHAGAPSGTEVTGKIHLERNKDVRTNPIPGDYNFAILRQNKGDFFDIYTDFDSAGRITGVLFVKDGVNLPAEKATYPVVVALKQGKKQIQKFTVKVMAADKTLWERFYDLYTPTVTENYRLYGKKKPTDEEVAAAIADLKANNGRFGGEKCYTTAPQDYPGQLNKHNHWDGGTIEYDWINVANRIGQLGYAYAKSLVYGPEGDPDKRAELREAIYDALLAYCNSVPVEGDDILVDGKPIGKYTGDGTSMLSKHKLASHQVLTHQWTLTDPLVTPILHLMPEMLAGIAAGEEKPRQVYDSLVRYFQLFCALIEGRRAIDDAKERWGEIGNPNYSSGAWADANLGHRSRTMLALPIIWADYNRPMTYVPYWYDDFYESKPYEGFTFARGWSPRGVAADVSYWMTRNNVPAHCYAQSGFQPDGTISHHTGHGTDAAMVSYGFEWLDDFNTGFRYFKGTPFEVDGKALQFELDRLLDVYPVMIYKGYMDYLVAGRGYIQDNAKFAKTKYPRAANALLKAVSKKSGVTRADQLRAVVKSVKAETNALDTTAAFWVNEYMVHRRGENGTAPFFVSLKLKSERTVGAEDFDRKVRKSWHMGSGILSMKVTGDEYAVPVLANFDWHALPGLTEEWRSDSIPLRVSSQASLPGLNKVAGVLSDGTSGMAIYHHYPREKYSSVKGFKTYHFNDNVVFAIGSGIERHRKGTGETIATFIDQGALASPLTICADGKTTVVNPGESVKLDISSAKTVWCHIGGKGYVIFPVGGSCSLKILSGDNINVTDRDFKVKGSGKKGAGKAGRQPGFIIAIDHGTNPKQAGYAYAMIANASDSQMPAIAKKLGEGYSFVSNVAKSHALRAADGTMQYAFFEPGEITLDGMTVSASDAAQLMLRETADSYILAASNPAPDDSKTSLTFTTSKPLPAGTYSYTAGGIYPIEGETVTVTPEGKGSRIVVELPDRRDEAKYNYQTILYSGVPVVINIPKK